MHKSVAEIKRLSSHEITGWQAYYQALDWMKNAQADTTEKAFEIARATHDILAERAAAQR